MPLRLKQRRDGSQGAEVERVAGAAGHLLVEEFERGRGAGGQEVLKVAVAG